MGAQLNAESLCLMIIRMQALELKIPPPAVAVLMAGAMWGISLVAPLLEVPRFIRVAARQQSLWLVLASASQVSFRSDVQERPSTQ